MKTHWRYPALAFVLILSSGFGDLSSPLHAQMTAVITSTADDINAHPWDDSTTTVDESTDGICEDLLHRATLRAALEEAMNMNNGKGVPCHVTFGVGGTIFLTQGVLSPPENSSIQGHPLLTLMGGLTILSLSNGTTVTDLNFKEASYGIDALGDGNTVANCEFSTFNTAVSVSGVQNTIGPGNLIHHMGIGVMLTGDDNIVKGNQVGIDSQDSLSGYGYGIMVVGADNIIGGADPGDRNVVSGNQVSGIHISTPKSGTGAGTIISGNFIGTDATGTQAKPNGHGIEVTTGNTRIGGSTPEERNVISGNHSGGILTRGDALAISIIGNNIGTDATATLSLPNGVGILLSPGSFDCLVENNSILYNGIGIEIYGTPTDPSWNHRIRGNKIKHTSFQAIDIIGTATDIVIGSSLSQDFAPNEIQFTGEGLPVGGLGVAISGTDTNGVPRRNTIRKNYFQDNRAPSIQIIGGAQDSIQSPSIQSYVDLGDGHAMVTVVHHRPGSRIDVYEGSRTSGPNYEGGPWLGEGSMGIDSTVTFQILISSTAHIVATATDGLENTSEFTAFEFTPLPITLLSFTGTVIHGYHVRLEWTTLTEINNYGFEVQRKSDTQSEYQTLPNSFIPGHGTTNEPQHYSYIDQTATGGVWFYRLKQIDLDGTVHYSDAIRVDMLTGVEEKELPTVFALSQNYPNPFNPTTTFSYQLPNQCRVTLRVYDALGREMATLVDGIEEPGYKAVEFDAGSIASGVYFYRLQAGDFAASRKLLLLK